ncbi:uncharacterized protein LOC113797250 [Dermatophagoides pteronyssinus]|uniref:uncharacterized protein LOC113797250 n=1 Tax=Dermatophagoides pteronyssinus TaxID=6956 RepID=UPI003F67F327
MNQLYPQLLLFVIVMFQIGDCFVINNNRGKSFDQESMKRNDTINNNRHNDDLDLIKDFDNEFTLDSNDGHNKFTNANDLIVLIAKPFQLSSSSSMDKKSKIMMPIIIEATRDLNNKNLIKWNVVNNNYPRYYYNHQSNQNNNNNQRQSSSSSLNNNQNHNNELIPPLSTRRGRFWSPQQAKLAKFKFLNFRKRFFPI